MFFKTQKKRFLAQKNVRSLSSFFLPFRRGQKNDWFKLYSSDIFLGVQGSLGLWRNMVAYYGCLHAILVFLLKTTSFVTCRSDRDVYSALSAWPWLLFQWRSWRRSPGFRGGRSFVISIFEYWMSTDIFFLVCLWKMNSHAKWSWMCVLQRTLFFVKAGGRFVTLHRIFF